MARPAEKIKELYTYKDYLEWGEDERCELIDGEIYAFSCPLPIHCDIHRELVLIIGNHLKGKSCTMYFSPYDVRLNSDSADDTVVQPDILVICDKSKQDKRSYKGAPDLAIEITSPSNAYVDRYIKYHKYLKAGVKEYWIVEPQDRIVNVFVLENGQYNHTPYKENEIVKSTILIDCVIDLKEVFPPEEGI